MLVGAGRRYLALSPLSSPICPHLDLADFVKIQVPSSAIGLMEDQVRRIKEKIESLTALHAGANAKQKRKLTAQMKEERKEVERLEKEIEEALEGRE